MSKANLFYAQSGGVTAVINASACGVIETARKHKDKIGKVYAGLNGIVGALHEELIDTNKEFPEFGKYSYTLMPNIDDPSGFPLLMEIGLILRDPQQK